MESSLDIPVELLPALSGMHELAVDPVFYVIIVGTVLKVRLHPDGVPFGVRQAGCNGNRADEIAVPTDIKRIDGNARTAVAQRNKTLPSSLPVVDTHGNSQSRLRRTSGR